MGDEAVELQVAGQKCRVVTTADAEELTLLASMVEEKLAQIIQPGRPVTTQAMILAAVALAHDVHSERKRADAIAETAKSKLRGALQRVEGALADSSVEQAARAAKKKQKKNTDGDE